ncbi:hypothetical protein FRC01_006131 [Tulasnella sp. 417]|nr:hypothetical protein FRC01_006131 [Tulasnella sp. 417]
MALTSGNDEHALLAVWQLVAELSEQLNQNRAATAALQAQGQAVHNGTGFVLRRFNTDLSKEVFESELERMNAALIMENQHLQHENKQLNTLLKEYEQTLETVMSKFRNQAHAAQQHELTLTRHYESLLLARESSVMSQDLEEATKVSLSLSRLSHYIRQAIRASNGEPVEDENGESSNANPDADAVEDNTRGYSGPEREDWALERESEINRLEKENEELRKLLKIDSSGAALVGATEEEWAGTDLSLGAPRRLNTGNFRGGSVAMGRKSSLMGGGRGTTIGGPSGFALQRPTGLGWMDKHQDSLLR